MVAQVVRLVREKFHERCNHEGKAVEYHAWQMPATEFFDWK